MTQIKTSQALEREKQKTIVGVVVSAEGHSAEQVDTNLHFCILENGDRDVIYVGTKRGGWFEGRFDLCKGKRILAHVDVPDLDGGGVLIQLGNILNELPPKKNCMGMGIDENDADLVVRNVGGFFK